MIYQQYLWICHLMLVHCTCIQIFTSEEQWNIFKILYLILLPALSLYKWFLVWYSAGSDLLAGCEEDGSGLWLHVVCPSVTFLFLCPERAGLSLPGCPNCHPQLQDLQECPAGCTEVRRGPPIQVSGPPLPFKWT